MFNSCEVECFDAERERVNCGNGDAWKRANGSHAKKTKFLSCKLVCTIFTTTATTHVDIEAWAYLLGPDFLYLVSCLYQAR